MILHRTAHWQKFNNRNSQVTFFHSGGIVTRKQAFFTEELPEELIEQIARSKMETENQVMADNAWEEVKQWVRKWIAKGVRI